MPFQLKTEPFRWQSAWRLQLNQTPLIQQDQFSLGGRYSVRGFDGELSLTGEKGWTWRNELGWNVAGRGQELYLALDAGRIWGRESELQLGKKLIGTALGLRGNLWGLDYDVFVGRPLKKPEGFRTSKIVTGFNLSYRF